MSTNRTVAGFVLTIDGGNGFEYGSREVRLNGALVGWRPYNGARESDMADEVAEALAAMLRERLGWPTTDPDEDEEAR